MGLSLRLLLVALVAALLPSAGAPARAAGDEPLPSLTQVRAPAIDGVRRFGRTLTADPGRWQPTPTTVRYRWYRDDVLISGVTSRSYRIRPDDVGHRISVHVHAEAPSYRRTVGTARTGLIAHRVDVRRTVRYSVRSKGRVPAVLGTFSRLAQQTYDDPRGWRGRGVRFVRVPSGGAFTLWLAEARTVPGFSSGCSAEWSCRVGRNVIINLTRWRNASPAWNRAGGSLRDYRHMVVNHETGHFLGRGHVGCPRRGAPAPVMMQQSKGLDGCRFNPWPTLAELRR
ncbi:DUF3152 domain-containing protein [Nocardioides caeni]|uniref:DUF3152 domain-containing protein n=1 Tax=Nocardioides caeni TaxID=574700 RepID=UPI0013051241|nr:DUF3152 domain-containing protein [Nocardioides caeni]